MRHEQDLLDRGRDVLPGAAAPPPARDPRAARAAPRVPDGERIYAIGDVHGRLDLLATLVARIRQDSAARGAARVRVVLLGDIVDRGPESAALVDRCRRLAPRTDAFVVLKGNHEAMMVHAIRGNLPALALWLRAGGDATLRSWGVADALIADGPSAELLRVARLRIPADMLAWLDALPLTLEIGDYLLVHAGIRPGVDLPGQTPEDLLWIRTEFLESDADHAFVVVHGHSVTDEGVVVRPNRIGIDTGAYRTDVLTALALEADRRWTLATLPAAPSARAGACDGEAAPRDSATIDAATAASDRLERDLVAIVGLDGGARPGARPKRARMLVGGALALALMAAVSATVLLELRPAGPSAPRHGAVVQIAVAPAPARPRDPAVARRSPAVVAQAAAPAGAADRASADRASAQGAGTLPHPLATHAATALLRTATAGDAGERAVFRDRTPAGRPTPRQTADTGAAPASAGEHAAAVAASGRDVSPSVEAAAGPADSVPTAPALGNQRAASDIAPAPRGAARPDPRDDLRPTRSDGAAQATTTRERADSVDAIRLLRRQ